MRHVAVLAIVLQCAFAGGASAQPSSSRPPTDVAQAQGEGVDYFVGRWQASSVDPRTGETMDITYTVEPTPGGSWIAGSGASADGSLNSRDMWGRDPISGELIRVIFDGSGTFAIVRSPGWKGDQLVLEGEARSSNGIVRVRESITRLAPHRFEAVWEAHRDGKWVAYAVEKLTRRS